MLFRRREIHRRWLVPAGLDHRAAPDGGSAAREWGALPSVRRRFVERSVDPGRRDAASRVRRFRSRADRRPALRLQATSDGDTIRSRLRLVLPEERRAPTISSVLRHRSRSVRL